MSTKKKKVIISVKPNGKKQNKNKKPHRLKKQYGIYTPTSFVDEKVE